MKTNRKTTRKTNRKPTRKTYKKKKKISDSLSSNSGLKYNNINTCIYLFKKYNITNSKLLIKWLNRNHPDKVKARNSVQSNEIIEDYRIITGCWANRKRIFNSMKKRDLSVSSKKSKRKQKKIKNIKD